MSTGKNIKNIKEMMLYNHPGSIKHLAATRVDKSEFSSKTGP